VLVRADNGAGTCDGADAGHRTMERRPHMSDPQAGRNQWGIVLTISRQSLVSVSCHRIGDKRRASAGPLADAVMRRRWSPLLCARRRRPGIRIKLADRRWTLLLRSVEALPTKFFSKTPVQGRIGANTVRNMLQ
jgi:hypothetical protein